MRSADDVVADDLAEDVQLADAPGDELAVLRAEVEDQDAFTFRSGVSWLILSLWPSSAARRVAASTASMRAPRTPPRSRACRPAMVVPPGLATMSLSTPGCASRFQHHLRRSQHRLRRQRRGHVARQTHAHAAVGQRLDHQIHERRPAAGQAGDGVEQMLGQPKRHARRR